MPAEQVNAWASYDQTATNARDFSNSNHRHGGNKVASDDSHLRRRVAGRHSLTSIYDLEKNFKMQKGFFETLILEKGTHTKKLQYEDIQKKKLVLNESVLADIRETFPVFFEEQGATTPPAESPCESSTELNNNKIRKETTSLVSIFKSIDATMPWVQKSVQSEFILFFEMCLRGICQIYFQNNPVSGLLFLAGFFAQSTRVAIHGMIGVISSTLFSRLFRFDKGLASSGLFGYNGVLVGLAIATFDSPEKHQGYKATTIVATIYFSLATSILLVMLGKLLVPYKSPPLTLPFNISVLFFLLAIAGMGHVDYDPVRSPALPEYGSADFSGITAKAFFAGTIRGVGQVCLCDYIPAGILILAGIAVCSRISAIAAIVGSAIGAATALFLGVPGSQIELGMFGFNASLSFTAMYMFYTPSLGAAVLGTLSAITTVIAQLSLSTALQPLGLPFMTLPFCIVALPFILIQGTTSIVIAVPLASTTTPEDHLRRVKTLSDGFAFLKESIVAIEEAKAPKSSLSRMKSKKIMKSLSTLSIAIEEVKKESYESAYREKYHLGDSSSKDPNKPRNSCSNATRSGFFLGKDSKETTLKATARSIFHVLDTNNTGQIPLDAVTDAFQVAGLSDEEYLNFAGLILALMDIDGSGTIYASELATFAVVSKSVHVIRNKISKFFDFVDSDGSGSIDLEGINAASDYLGESRMTEEEMGRIRQLTNSSDERVDVVELVNAITVSKVRLFVDVYEFEISTHKAHYNI